MTNGLANQICRLWATMTAEVVGDRKIESKISFGVPDLSKTLADVNLIAAHLKAALAGQRLFPVDVEPTDRKCSVSAIDATGLQLTLTVRNRHGYFTIEPRN
jgi:hypothetical protein